MRRVALNPIFVSSFGNLLQDSSLSSFTKLRYLPEFVALEIMDAIWINEVYIPHTDSLADKFKAEITWTH